MDNLMICIFIHYLQCTSTRQWQCTELECWGVLHRRDVDNARFGKPRKGGDLVCVNCLNSQFTHTISTLYRQRWVFCYTSCWGNSKVQVYAMPSFLNGSQQYLRTSIDVAQAQRRLSKPLFRLRLMFCYKSCWSNSKVQVYANHILIHIVEISIYRRLQT